MHGYYKLLMESKIQKPQLTFEFQFLRFWYRLGVNTSRFRLRQVILWNACIWLDFEIKLIRTMKNLQLNYEPRLTSVPQSHKLSLMINEIALPPFTSSRKCSGTT